MSFQAPVWIHNNKAYNIKITTKQSYIFTSISEFQDTHKIPNTNNDEFQAVFSKIGEKIVDEGKLWFASPIKIETFEKKANNIFNNELSHQTYTYGKLYQETWKLKSIWVYSNRFELEWNLIDLQPYEDSIIPSDFLNFKEEFNTLEPFGNRTIIIQPTKDELLEQDDIPFESSEQDDTFSPRAILKEKISKAKVKFMLSQMKLTDLEKKYFRLYGEDPHLDSDNSSVTDDSLNEE